MGGPTSTAGGLELLLTELADATGGVAHQHRQVRFVPELVVRAPSTSDVEVSGALRRSPTLRVVPAAGAGWNVILSRTEIVGTRLQRSPSLRTGRRLRVGRGWRAGPRSA